jgi:hypothetical protein
MLGAISPCLHHSGQCLRKIIGDKALCSELQHHVLRIIPPPDPLNDRITTRLPDMNRVYGPLLPSSLDRNTCDHWWLRYNIEL